MKFKQTTNKQTQILWNTRNLQKCLYLQKLKVSFHEQTQGKNFVQIVPLECVLFIFRMCYLTPFLSHLLQIEATEHSQHSYSSAVCR